MSCTSDREIRVRFAPSPTGHLHIGSFRTALFNWLFARHNKGIFLVRIEDTDRERSKQEYTESIMSALSWVGLNLDEPLVVQSERVDRHKQVIEQLLKEGKAYKCFCSSEDIKKRAGDAAFIKYDGWCESHGTDQNKPYAVRFKIPKTIKEISFDDLIRGKITIPREQLDDFIIARSDGSPTYNFVVVVDDADMNITQVIRGEDHISNTPKQILLYEACNFNIPQFAHIPLILGPSGDRLSKRDGAVSALEYKKLGYMPDALVNYLVRLGWSHGDQEIFSREELIKFFTLSGVGKKGSIFDIEKLNWLNGVYLRGTSATDLTVYIVKELDPTFIEYLSQWDESSVALAVDLYKERAQTLCELIKEVFLLHDGPSSYTAADIEKWTDQETKGLLEKIIINLKQITQFTVPVLKQEIKQLSEQLKLKMVKLAQPIRIALIGKSAGPGVFDMLAVIGKSESIVRLSRLHDAL